MDGFVEFAVGIFVIKDVPALGRASIPLPLFGPLRVRPEDDMIGPENLPAPDQRQPVNGFFNNDKVSPGKSKDRYGHDQQKNQEQSYTSFQQDIESRRHELTIS